MRQLLLLMSLQGLPALAQTTYGLADIGSETPGEMAIGADRLITATSRIGIGSLNGTVS